MQSALSSLHPHCIWLICLNSPYSTLQFMYYTSQVTCPVDLLMVWYLACKMTSEGSHPVLSLPTLNLAHLLNQQECCISGAVWFPGQCHRRHCLILLPFELFALGTGCLGISLASYGNGRSVSLEQEAAILGQSVGCKQESFFSLFLRWSLALLANLPPTPGC